MNALLEAVVENVQVHLPQDRWERSGGANFVRREGVHGRKELISFTSRNGRSAGASTIYIGVTSGIYLEDVNLRDKAIVADFLNSYPIVSGSIGHYRTEHPRFVSIPLSEMSQIDAVSTTIVENIELGAFNLFDRYATITDIIAGIEAGDSWLRDYNQFATFRRLIRVAAMYCVAHDKDTAIRWFDARADQAETEKRRVIETMQEKW